MFFALSIILIAPFGNIIPTSPVCNQPFLKASLVFISSLKYPGKTEGP